MLVPEPDQDQSTTPLYVPSWIRYWWLRPQVSPSPPCMRRKWGSYSTPSASFTAICWFQISWAMRSSVMLNRSEWVQVWFSISKPQPWAFLRAVLRAGLLWTTFPMANRVSFAPFERAISIIWFRLLTSFKSSTVMAICFLSVSTDLITGRNFCARGVGEGVGPSASATEGEADRAVFTGSSLPPWGRNTISSTAASTAAAKSA